MQSAKTIICYAAGTVVIKTKATTAYGLLPAVYAGASGRRKNY
jgi:hypothetical protein